MPETFDYPEARRDETVVDDFHGTNISDPYRWLENPDSEEVQAYVEAQNRITQPFLEKCDEWQLFNEKIKKLWDYPKYSPPSRHGNRYFYFMNTGLQNQSVLYVQETLQSEPKVFLDPNILSDDGTISLSGYSFSDDGNIFAYGLSESGSDWIKIRFCNVNTGEDYSDTLVNVKFSSLAWTKDNKGIFYGKYPIQEGKNVGSETGMNENQKLYYHWIGESQDNDVLVVEFPDNPTWRMRAEVSQCGKYLILPIIKDCRDNILFYVDLELAGDIKEKFNIIPIVDKFEADYHYITNTGSVIVFRTNKDAPNYRLITIDLNQPEQSNWKTLVPEHELDVLDWALCVHTDKLVLGFIKDVKSVLNVHSLIDGKFLLQLPLDIGAVYGCSGEEKYSEIFYNFVSFVDPGTIYHYDFASETSKKPTVFRKIEIKLDNFDKDDINVEQVFYPSKDGTKIPMFIVQKGYSGGGEPRPCILYGYGGFNVSLQPFFSVTNLTFIDTFNGVFAMPNLRGGGEYGERWHNSGRLFNKQNVFDDFNAAAKYLVDNEYTTKDKLAIQGASNGGLLVGACINQRPDLFGAAIAQVGVMDMLRYHKFTIGHAWMSDYGNPDEKEHFNNLIKYSPLHNVRKPLKDSEQYPSTLLLTADHDDRVSPLHSLKFAAALHNVTRKSGHQKNPLLLRVYSKAGHGAGKPTSKKIAEAADILTFLYRALKLKIINK